MEQARGPITPSGTPPKTPSPERRPRLSKTASEPAMQGRMQTTSVSVPPGFECQIESLRLSPESGVNPSVREVLPQKERKIAGVSEGELPKTRILEEIASIESDFKVFHNDALIDVAEFLTHKCGWLDQEKKQAVLAMLQAIDEDDLNPDNVLIVEEHEALGDHPESDIVRKIFNAARFEKIVVGGIVDRLNKLEKIRGDLHCVSSIEFKQIFAKVWFYKVVLYFKNLMVYGEPGFCPKEGINILMAMMLYGCHNELYILLPVSLLRKVLEYLNIEKKKGTTPKFGSAIIDKLKNGIPEKQRLEALSSKRPSEERGQGQAESATALQEVHQGWDYESTKKKVITLLDDPDQEDFVDISSLPTQERLLDEKGNLFPNTTCVLQYTWLIGKEITGHAHVMSALKTIRQVFNQLTPEDGMLAQAFWCCRAFKYLCSLKYADGKKSVVKRCIDETIEILRKENRRCENVFASHYIGINILEKAAERFEFLIIMGHECEDTRSLLFGELETEKKLESIRLLADEIVKDQVDRQEAKEQAGTYRRDYTKPLMISGAVADRHELLRHYEMMVISCCDLSDTQSIIYLLELAEGNLSGNKIPFRDIGLLTRIWLVSLIELFDVVTDDSEIYKDSKLFERVYKLIRIAVVNGAYENLSFMYIDILETALHIATRWKREAGILFQCVRDVRVSLSENLKSVMPPEPDSDTQTSDEEASGVTGSYDVTVTQTLETSDSALPQALQVGHSPLSEETINRQERQQLNQTISFVQQLLDGSIDNEELASLTANTEVSFALPIPVSEGSLSDTELNTHFIYLLFCWYREIPNETRLKIWMNVYSNTVSKADKDSDKRLLLLKLLGRRLVEIADFMTLPECSDDFDIHFDFLLEVLKIAIGSDIHKILPYEKLDELDEVLENIVNRKESEEAKSLLKSVEERKRHFEMPIETDPEQQPGTLEYEGAAAFMPAGHELQQEGSETGLPVMPGQFSDVAKASALPGISGESTSIEIADIDSYVDNILEKREFDNQVQIKDLDHSSGRYISCFEEGDLSRDHAGKMLNYILRIDYEMVDSDALMDALRPVQDAMPRITDKDRHMRCARFFTHQMIENISRLAGCEYLYEDEIECFCVFLNGLEWCLKQGFQTWFSNEVVCDVLAQIYEMSCREEIECSEYLKTKFDEYLNQHPEPRYEAKALFALAKACFVQQFSKRPKAEVIFPGFHQCTDSKILAKWAELIEALLSSTNDPCSVDSVEDMECANYLFGLMGDCEDKSDIYITYFCLAVESSQMNDIRFVVNNLPGKHMHHHIHAVKKGFTYIKELRRIQQRRRRVDHDKGLQHKEYKAIVKSDEGERLQSAMRVMAYENALLLGKDNLSSMLREVEYKEEKAGEYSTYICPKYHPLWNNPVCFEHISISMPFLCEIWKYYDKRMSASQRPPELHKMAAHMLNQFHIDSPNQFWANNDYFTMNEVISVVPALSVENRQRIFESRPISLKELVVSYHRNAYFTDGANFKQLKQQCEGLLYGKKKKRRQSVIGLDAVLKLNVKLYSCASKPYAKKVKAIFEGLKTLAYEKATIILESDIERTQCWGSWLQAVFWQDINSE